MNYYLDHPTHKLKVTLLILSFLNRQLLAEMAREAEQLPSPLEFQLTGKPSPAYCHHAVPLTMDSTYRAHFEEKDMTGMM